MERLLIKKDGKFYFKGKEVNPQFGSHDMSPNDNVKLYNRLAELEDMIESGKLIFAPEATAKRVCNVGDKVFMPWEYGGAFGVATLEITQIVESNNCTIYASNIPSDDYDYLMKYNFGNFLEKDFGQKVFLNPTQALEKLAEIKKLYQDSSKLYNKRNKKCCTCGKVVEFARDIICNNEPSFICRECDERDARDTVCQTSVIPAPKERKED